MSKELESVIVVSKVKESIKNLEMRSGEEFVTALNEKVHSLIKEASERCKANGRQTLKPEDL